MSHLDRLRADLGNRYKPGTTEFYLGHAGRFVRHAGEKASYSRQDVLGFVDHMLAQEYANATITAALAAVKRLCRAIECPYPLQGEGVHLPRRGPQVAPALEDSAVAALIVGARHSPFPATPLVALSSVYGLRVGELAKVLNAGLQGTWLSLNTLKTETPRTHRIPRVLVATLTFSPYAITPLQCHLLFRQLMQDYVHRPESREGFHAIRRRLITDLVMAGVPEPLVARWMGKSAGAGIDRYIKASTQELDVKVYTAHPFLRLWV